MSKQDLDGTKVSGHPVDDRDLGPPKRVGAILASYQTNPCNPFVDEPGILPRAEMPIRVNPTGKNGIIDRAAPSLEPCPEAGTCIGQQFKLDWPPGLLLHDDGSCPDLPAADQVANLDLHEVTAPQLAVYRQVEQCPISQAAMLIEVETNPQICFGFRARFAPTVLPAFQTGRFGALSSDSFSMIILRWPDGPSEERITVE